MLELGVILVFAVMFLGPCALATGIANNQEEDSDEELPSY